MTSDENVFGELMEVNRVLWHDVFFCLPMIQTEESLPTDERFFWCRTFVRSCFAMFEGTIAMMKRVSYYYGETWYNYPFTPGEIAALTEQTYRVARGEIVPESMRISLVENLKFAFVIFAKIYDVPFKLDTGSHKWESFQKAIKIRDRLMHPKAYADVHAFAELGFVIEAASWFQQECTRLFTLANARLASDVPIDHRT